MAGKPGKTAPRLLQDLLTYDPRFEERAGRNLLTSPPPQHDPGAPPVAAVPHRNCRHTFFNKSEQCQLPQAGEEINHTTIYKVAAFCTQCHWHVDVIVDLRDDGFKNEPCRKGSEYLLHHFLYEGSDETNGNSALGSEKHARTYTFRCSAPRCPAELRIAMKPPRFSENDITVLTNRAHLRRRLEVAKQLAGERADTAMARPVDAPDFLSTYLQDCLNPQKGKSRIPLLNRKFLKTFGRDCDSILNRLGFTHHTEFDDDENAVEVWHLPKPPEAEHPLEPTDRNIIEDARYELDAIIKDFPESERSGSRHQPMHPMPSRADIERALACEDYDKAKGRMETRNSNHEEDHPYYAGLGAIGDFADHLLLWSYARQSAVDEANGSYYFECLQDLAVGRGSAELETQVAMLASQGMFNRREVASAYRYFGIDPQHADAINDEHIIGVFRSRLSDIGPSQIEETRKQLRIIGNARGSLRIQQESSDAIETYEQALSWLDLDEGQPDDFVIAMLTLKTNDTPGSMETAKKAVSIIAQHRNSHRLREFLETGTMEEAEMDVGEAYALLRIPDRASKVPLAVLQSQLAVDQAENPANAAKLQKAFEIVLRDQEENFNNIDHDTLPMKARKQEHPLESWPVGCQNIGNTCYLNSVLQFLFTIKPLRDMVLNCEEYMQDVSPEALENKKVGRSAVTPQRVEIAQKFVRELRSFFEHMITAPTHEVRPAVTLAALALTKTEVPEAVAEEKSTGDASLGTIGGAPIIGPMPHPVASTLPITSPADSVMGDDNEDADSMKAMDLSDETKDIKMEDSDRPPPPTRPPPIPPRPQTSGGSKIQVIEESARQQDAAEIMQNIFDLISCAIKGDGVLRDGEQQDLVKKLFFSDVTTVRSTKEGSKSMTNSALQDSILVSTKNRDRHIHAGLDDEFGISEEEDGATKFEYFAEAAPIQIVTVRRQQFDRETKLTTKDKSYLALDAILYLDRYLNKTRSYSEEELQKLREIQWEKQQQLRALERRRKELQETEFQNTDLPTVLEETATIANEISVANGGDHAQLLEALLEKATNFRSELEAIDAPMAQLENEIDTVFRDCHDHPYLLHAVFMHRGNSSGGHYWIYIYDFQNTMWRKYNDEYVDEISEKLIYDKEEGANPATSTGIVYIRRDLAHKLTEAVMRMPAVSQETTTTDVKMEDTADHGPEPVASEPPVKDLQVINGIDPSKEGWVAVDEDDYTGHLGSSPGAIEVAGTIPTGKRKRDVSSYGGR